MSKNSLELTNPTFSVSHSSSERVTLTSDSYKDVELGKNQLLSARFSKLVKSESNNNENFLKAQELLRSPNKLQMSHKQSNEFTFVSEKNTLENKKTNYEGTPKIRIRGEIQEEKEPMDKIRNKTRSNIRFNKDSIKKPKSIKNRRRSNFIRNDKFIRRFQTKKRSVNKTHDIFTRILNKLGMIGNNFKFKGNSKGLDENILKSLMALLRWVQNEHMKEGAPKESVEVGNLIKEFIGHFDTN
jgi:hypothetical protein